jgi:vacuolar-type H+-ATPase subunit I/STV1
LTKDILIQYSELVEEVKDLRKRIDNIERQIDKIETEGNVIDSVKGGYGGIQHFKIEGFPDPEYSKKKTRLYLNKAQLESAELELLELTNQVEDYIQSIDNSRMRRIFRLRYIDGKTWLQVAQGIGERATADSVRMEHDRYMARE